jgi:hypothetical protein
MDAGIPMPALVSSMPMPSFALCSLFVLSDQGTLSLAEALSGCSASPIAQGLLILPT